MHGKIVLVSVLSGCAILLSHLAEAQPAQSTRSVWDGVYTDAQAERGAVQYVAHCARCHAANLSGSFETPPLMGRFIPYWSGTTLDKLLDYVNISMPLDHPGQVERSADADILAFILKQNGFPAGTNELSGGADSLKTITFDAHKPEPERRNGKPAKTKKTASPAP